MPAPWPPGFTRIPDEPWTRHPIDELARGYDRLGQHGWYANLDPVVERVRGALQVGDVLVDYSGGTGLFIDRLLAAEPGLQAGVLNVDASAKFLRLCLEKWGRDDRVALRLVQYVPEVRRLQALDEVLGAPLLGSVAVVVSANAVHLYYDLVETLAAWRRVLRPEGRVFVQSGNIRRVGMEGRWIIDETVHAIAREAERVVRDEARFAPYRAVLEDRTRMEAYEALRRRYFLPVKPLHHYLDALEAAGLHVERVEHRDVPVRVDEWVEFLSVYHEGILGWLGGSEKIEGRPPSPEAVAHRREVLAEAAQRVFGKPRFTAEWTYLDARRDRPGDAGAAGAAGTAQAAART